MGERACAMMCYGLIEDACCDGMCVYLCVLVC